MKLVVLAVCFYCAVCSADESDGIAALCPAGDEVCVGKGKSMMQVSSAYTARRSQQMEELDVVVQGSVLGKIAMEFQSFTNNTIAPLNSTGFASIQSQCCAPVMSNFIERMINQSQGVVCNLGALNGFTSHYDCPGDNSYDDLIKDIDPSSAARNGSCAWIRSSQAQKCPVMAPSCAFQSVSPTSPSATPSASPGASSPSSPSTPSLAPSTQPSPPAMAPGAANPATPPSPSGPQPAGPSAPTLAPTTSKPCIISTTTTAATTATTTVTSTTATTLQATTTVTATTPAPLNIMGCDYAVPAGGIWVKAASDVKVYSKGYLHFDSSYISAGVSWGRGTPINSFSNLPSDRKVYGMRIEHVSGSVACGNDATSASNFGCLSSCKHRGGLWLLPKNQLNDDPHADATIQSTCKSSGSCETVNSSACYVTWWKHAIYPKERPADRCDAPRSHWAPGGSTPYPSDCSEYPVFHMIYDTRGYIAQPILYDLGPDCSFGHSEKNLTLMGEQVLPAGTPFELGYGDAMLGYPEHWAKYSASPPNPDLKATYNIYFMVVPNNVQ